MRQRKSGVKSPPEQHRAGEKPPLCPRGATEPRVWVTAADSPPRTPPTGVSTRPRPYLTRQRHLHPTEPAVTAAAVTAPGASDASHKNNNLLAGVRSREAAAGEVSQCMPGLVVHLAPPARRRQRRELQLPKRSAARLEEAAGSWAKPPRILTTSGPRRPRPVSMDTSCNH